MSWQEVLLGDAIHIKHGFAFKSQYFSEAGKYIVLTPGNFHEQGGFRSRPGKDRFYQGEIPDEYVLSEGDVIVAMTEQGEGLLGSSAWIPKSDVYLHNQRLGLVDEVDGNLLDRKFLYHLFNTRPVRQQIYGSATGTKVRHTAPVRIYRVKVKIPPISQQKRIAEIIDGYDDLMENNQRRIQLLEESAQLLYKEWFVHLRFPGHEHVKVTNGVPKGWEQMRASDCMEILSGGTPKTTVEAYWGGDIPFFTPKDSVDSCYAGNTAKKLTETGLASCNSRLYPKDTVFVTARGTVGKVNLAQVPMAMNQSCYALVAKPPVDQYFLYFSLVYGVDQLRSRAVGAVFDAIVRDTFKQIPFVVPDDKILKAFLEHLSPIIQQIDALSTQSRSLAKARDLLLPKLMSGELAA